MSTKQLTVYGKRLVRYPEMERCVQVGEKLSKCAAHSDTNRHLADNIKDASKQRKSYEVMNRRMGLDDDEDMK